MQKKLIALAVAGLASTAAFAQSNVTIYGVADAGYAYSSGERSGTLPGSANFSGIQSGLLAGSRIGFKGEEGLGNGLKAVFTLEYHLAVDADEGIGTVSTLKARQQFVGLNHAKLGQLTAGRQYAPAFSAQTRNDAMISSDISALKWMNTAGGNSIQGSSNARWNNSVAYASPNWSGFTASAIYSFGESNTNATAAATAAGGASGANNGISTGDDGRYGLGLNYANGPLNLDAVYQTRRSVPNTTVNGVTVVPTRDAINEWMIGGSYDFQVVKVMATYQDQSDNNGSSTTEIGNRVWSVGAVVPVFGNGKIHVSYADLKWDRRGAGSSDGWSLGYTHALSKRTTLYTGYTYADNDRNAVVAAGAVAATRALGESNGTFVAGMNHTF